MSKINKKIFQTALIVVVALTALFVVPAIGLAENVVFDNPPGCQISFQTGDILVNFSGQYLLAADPAYPPIARSANMPAGYYDIYLQSFDGYNIRAGVSQPHEQYLVLFKNSGGEIARTNATNDLQDYVGSASWSGQVGNNLYLSGDANQAVAQHAYYGDGSTGANSVRAICMVARPRQTPTPTPTPTYVPTPTPTPTYTPAPVYSLSLQKTVRNLTKGTNLSSLTNADSGDRVLFLIEAGAPGNGSAANVRVWDNLPFGLNYVNGSTRIDGGYSSDSLVSGGINLGIISGNQTKSVTFEAIVSGSGPQILTNYVYASADNIGQRSAFAQVAVNAAPVPLYTSAPPAAPVSVPQGSVVAAVTGGNDLFRNIVLAAIISLWGIFIAYMIMEYPAVWRGLRMRMKITRLKILNR